ncbi:hypothetical protein MRB53_032866 [Persea americana]|uniref:Uncharacterized protein n=1 Tax=Persea americana TaxID=3435 RepID=A0ACC2KTY7_PERAE|nr:hypothetical protein MRB53_032866 [Persea americana]
MASFTFSKLPLALFLSLSIFLHGALGNIICENLPKDVCAFSISSTGKRCLIETSSREDGTIEYQCRASEVTVERMKDWIETEEFRHIDASDGVFLPDLCEVQRTNPHRAMLELLSSGAAPGPFPAEASSAFLAPAPM